MDTLKFSQKLASREPLFDSIPAISKPRICGLESELGCLGYDPVGFEFLTNGGLIYDDSGHPEIATPEVSNPLSAVLYYEAGKQICHEGEVAQKLYCNNNSWGSFDREDKDATFGAHESYAVRAPRTFWGRLVPFLVARTVLCGAGWLTKNGEYRISQRAEHIMRATGDSTTENRAIVNLVHEPLMHQTGHDRLHLICGDATMNQVATLLRVGTMSLVAEMLDLNALPEIRYDEDRASQDIQGISRRMSGWYVGGIKGRSRCLLNLLDIYRERAASLFAKRDVVTDLVLYLWKDTLEKLGRDPMELCYRLDWVAKAILLDEFRKEENCTLGWLGAQDMEYHNLNPEQGLYYGLLEMRQAEQLFTPALITRATSEPPDDTRAYARGKIIQYLLSQAGRYEFVSTEWGRIGIIDTCGDRPILSRGMPDPFHTYHELVVACRKMYY